MTNKISSAFFAFSLCFASLEAGAVTIGFDAFPNGAFDPGETYTEDGFVFTVLSGNEFGNFGFFGNPDPALEVGTGGPVGIGDTISIAAVAGTLFTFDAFDLASFASSQSDGVDLIGLVNGIQTESLLNVFAASTSWNTVDPLFNAAIDELQIVGSSAGFQTLGLDNFEFSAVPAPATLALMGLGVAGFGFARGSRQQG